MFGFRNRAPLGPLKGVNGRSPSSSPRRLAARRSCASAPAPASRVGGAVFLTVSHNLRRIQFLLHFLGVHDSGVEPLGERLYVRGVREPEHHLRTGIFHDRVIYPLTGISPMDELI